ncbi:Toll/interleukin-1 receptor domain-containing protein [Tanacetum coccineum]
MPKVITKDAGERRVQADVSSDNSLNQSIDPQITNTMASTSVSSIRNSFMYDVFLSFRGEDTRNSFVGHLFQALKQKGIDTYKDDEKIEQGEEINDQLMRSIQESRFFIIVFSKTYASSSWCLDELVKIIECQKKTGEQTAYPVFFDVEPTQVRKQSGPVKEAFAELEKKEAAGKWREAMKEASSLAGWELKKIVSGDESKLIQIIVDKIFRKLCSISLSIDRDLIGMEIRKKEVLSSLDIGTNDVRVIGIKGIGGGGKTTLAKAVYDQISTHFDGKSFVADVREVSKTSKTSMSGLKTLQQQILKDVFDGKDISISGVLDGKDKMRQMMPRKKVLVVLDDVDDREQLEALVDNFKSFKPGSRIIITTRDEQVLLSFGVRLICNVNLLTDEEAVCLFRRYAFGEEIPNQGFNEMSGHVVRYAAGLPLTIKVLGSFLCCKSEHEWKDALERLKKVPEHKTLEILKISYDALEKRYKKIFLDVACILKGEQKDKAIRVLESRGFHATIGLRVLEQKCLINISQSGSLGMHDLIEEMGKHIVRRSDPNEPYRDSRLWIKEKTEDILDNDLINERIRCIKLSQSELEFDTVMRGLRNMRKLRVLYMCSGANFDDSKVRQCFPDSLQYLSWRSYPFEYLHETFQADNLVGLDMSFSSIELIWKWGKRKVLNKLRFLDLSYSNLKILNLKVTPKLEILNLVHCANKELYIAHGCPKLQYLNLDFSNFEKLDLGPTPDLETTSHALHPDNSFPKFQFTCFYKEDPAASSFGNLKKLISIGLCSCTNLESFSRSIYSLQCLEKLTLEGSIPVVYKDFQQLLAVLDSIHSKLTNKLHLGNIPNLEKLILKGRNDLIEFQMPAESLNLQHLNLSHSKLKTIQLGNTPSLKELILKGCNDLVEFQMPDKRLWLKDLDLSHSKLKTIQLRNTPYLEKLILKGCNDLVEFQMPDKCLRLKDLDLSHSKLKTIQLGNAPYLEKLILKGCNDLVEFQMPDKCLWIKDLDLSHSKLKTIQLRNTSCLEKLILKGCNDLVEFQMPAESLNLQHLNLSHSKLKTIQLGNTPNLEKLILKGCNDLVEFQIPDKCLWLRDLDLSHSKLRTLDLGPPRKLSSLNLENCCDLVEINAPIGTLFQIDLLALSGCGRFKNFWFDKQFNLIHSKKQLDSLSELHLIGETIDVCQLHPDNSFQKFRFECYYDEDPYSVFGNLEMLISMGLCACTNLEKFSRSICSLRGLRKLTLEGSIPEVPRDLDQLECLEELIFSSSNIRNLPDSIYKLKHLKSLELKSCLLLKKLPDDLGRIESLETLTITDCDRLRDIPNNLGGSVSLKRCQSAHKERKFPESPWGSPIPIGDGDEDEKRFPNGDGDGDGDEAHERGWGW